MVFSDLEQPGAFVISLDFEIIWGVFDKPRVKDYYLNHLLGVPRVIPELLQLFETYHIHATFATVGMLFAEDRSELLAALPSLKPQYRQPHLSPYTTELNHVGTSEREDPLHFAYSLIDKIKKTPFQEVGCHTFCHYYCLEEGQTADQFREDIRAAVALAATKGVKLTSLVFPRNQFNQSYIKILGEFGFTSYRGNEHSWIYEARGRNKESKFRKGVRLTDAYINISGHNVHSWRSLSESGPPFNITASRFLRPYNKKLNFLEPWRLNRIKKDMTSAAKSGGIYHLWWHPHNFGVNTEHNIEFLRKIFEHYNFLKEKYNFLSLNMNEVALRLNEITHVRKTT